MKPLFTLLISFVLCAFTTPQNFYCDSNNPYDNDQGVTAPQGPFMCPQGQSLDQQCVDALLDNFDVCVAAAQLAARVDYYHDCMDAQGEVQAAWKLFNGGLITAAQRDAIITQSLANLATEQQDTNDTFWDSVGDCSESFYAMMENCCSGD